MMFALMEDERARDSVPTIHPERFDTWEEANEEAERHNSAIPMEDRGWNFTEWSAVEVATEQQFTFTVKVEAANQVDALKLMLELKGIADDRGNEMVWYLK